MQAPPQLLPLLNWCSGLMPFSPQPSYAASFTGNGCQQRSDETWEAWASFQVFGEKCALAGIGFFVHCSNLTFSATTLSTCPCLYYISSLHSLPLGSVTVILLTTSSQSILLRLLILVPGHPSLIPLDLFFHIHCQSLCNVPKQKQSGKQIVVPLPTFSFSMHPPCSDRFLAVATLLTLYPRILLNYPSSLFPVPQLFIKLLSPLFTPAYQRCTNTLI